MTPAELIQIAEDLRRLVNQMEDPRSWDQIRRQFCHGEIWVHEWKFRLLHHAARLHSCRDVSTGPGQ